MEGLSLAGGSRPLGVSQLGKASECGRGCREGAEGNKSGCLLLLLLVSTLGIWKGDKETTLRTYPGISRDLRPGSGLHYIIS